MDTIKDDTYYFPWVRKGLSITLAEQDRLGDLSGSTELLAKMRPQISVTTKYEATQVELESKEKKDPAKEKKDLITVLENKELQFVGPGDIVGVSHNAIMKVTPKENSEGFSRQYYPYIEFWEVDFPWRYTPACHNQNKLTPWIALLVCEKSRCNVVRLPNGASQVTFSVNATEYPQVFPNPKELWKCAHAQGFTIEEPVLSRLLALRGDQPLKEDTEYCAFLVPAFETGRLRGLGVAEEELCEFLAQMPAWEETSAKQENRKYPFVFPIYYSWSFITGGDSFDAMVRNLKVAGGFGSEINIDVTHMGEGLDYEMLLKLGERPAIDTMGMATAAVSIEYDFKKQTPFPLQKTEPKLYKNLKDLISRNPVFQENIAETSGKYLITKTDEVGDDDPWVAPPVYGGKHIMATSIEESVNKANDTPWLTQLNLDIHHRAVAGLGKKTVQTNQEEFVNRAWKQVESINALNHELRKMLLSVNINQTLAGKVLKSLKRQQQSPSKYVAGMMRQLSSMKKAKARKGRTEVSLSNIMQSCSIPEAFATASFQNLTEALANTNNSLDATTLMQNIAENQIWKMEAHDISNIPTFKMLQRVAPNIIYEDMKTRGFDRYFSFRLPKETDSPLLEDIFNLQNLHLTHVSTYEETNKVLSNIVVPKNRYMYYSEHLERTFRIYPYKTLSMYILLFDMYAEKGYDSLEYPRPVSLSSGNYNARPEMFQETYDNISEFFKHLSEVKGLISFYGTTKYADKEMTVLGFEDDQYKKLFGPDAPAMIIMKGRCFISKKGAEQVRAVDKGAVKMLKYLPCFGNTIYRKGTIGESYHFSMYAKTLGLAPDDPFYLLEESDSKEFLLKEMDYDASKGWYIDNYTSSNWYLSHSYNVKSLFHPIMRFLLLASPYISPSASYQYERIFQGLRDSIETSIAKNEALLCDRTKKDSKFLDLQNKAINYVIQPDIIELTFTNRVLQDASLYGEISTVSDYIKYIPIFTSKYKEGLLKFLSQVGPNTPVKAASMEDTYKQIQTKVKNPKVEAPTAAQTTALQEAFQDNEAYDAMREIAERYYREFFSNTKLITTYLDELLHSKYPIMAYPMFPEPVYYYLKMFSEKFILPCINDLPADSIAAFKSNPAFEEAYLCGMNTEMGRELLWREYPTDQRGSYFRKFWDSETALQDMRDNNFFDINPVHTWSGNLGENHTSSKTDLLLFTIKGRLMKQFPSTQVYLHKGALNDKGQLKFDYTAKEGNGLFFPVIQAVIKDDILIVGFKTGLSDKEMIDTSSGYFLTFKEDVQDLNFEDDDTKDQTAGTDAAKVAQILKNDPTLYGKHLSLFM
ncbi:MAG: hypothetical protein FWC10_06910 [Lentimicrobiaceae bacterium]|nr:hypothetical protein [Lentimicrobiaceae bacterium]